MQLVLQLVSCVLTCESVEFWECIILLDVLVKYFILYKYAVRELLYNTWNSAQCYVAAWMGGGFRGNVHIYKYRRVPSSILSWTGKPFHIFLVHDWCHQSWLLNQILVGESVSLLQCDHNNFGDKCYVHVCIDASVLSDSLQPHGL